jgi:hypothetical protein
MIQVLDATAWIASNLTMKGGRLHHIDHRDGSTRPVTRASWDEMLSGYFEFVSNGKTCRAPRWLRSHIAYRVKLRSQIRPRYV